MYVLVIFQHTDPDYSNAYVILKTDQAALEGHGYTFTIGRGTEVGKLKLECTELGLLILVIYRRRGFFF
jgi:hypothetical protein